jgi:hypothetical protein
MAVDNLIALAVVALVAYAAREVLVYWMRPVDDRAWRAARSSRTWLAAAWTVASCAGALVIGVRAAIVLLGVTYLLFRLCCHYFEWRYGGLPGWGASASFTLFAVCGAAVVFLLRRLW